MLNYTLILVSIFTLGTNQSKAQDSLLVSKNFLFKDGIYMNLEAFQNNQPDYSWADVDADYFANPQTFLTSVNYIRHDKNPTQNQNIDLNTIWALCIDGIPYIQLEEEPSGKQMKTYAALKVRGKICYLTYSDKKTIQFPMSAYNPLTGRPFRTAMIEREFDVQIEKILNFETGEVADFTIENFLKWILDDPRLIQSINELSQEEAQEKLFKCLLIYDDRNEVFVPGNIEDAIKN
ncbi:MAG: hypothetical protein NXI23_03510 [Bacteroidetes bacterium]|jgi:hypothetical protein|nr:hypothetical protein [Bacteroidota bacterium]MDF1865211.1 hypothetical protein [Saprospiraceae bacterium]